MVVFPQIHRNTVSDTPRPGDIGQPLLNDRTSNDLETRIQGQGLTGDVYELTIEDARTVTVALSNHLVGKIYLTDTYETSTASFITIPISDELTSRLVEQRQRVM
jgi:hypothetical protein